MKTLQHAPAPSFVPTLLCLVLLLPLVWLPARAQVTNPFSEAFTFPSGIIDGGSAWGDYDDDGDLVLAGSPFAPEQSFIETSLEATPAAFDYGSVDVGTTVSQTIVVTNTSTTEAIEVFAEVPMEGNAAGDFIITSGGGALFLDAGESHDVTVAFTPSDDGFRGATLRFAVNTEEVQLLDVPLSGLGVALPMLTVTATDGLFEDRVEIRWSGVTGDELYYRIERDGTALTVVGSDGAMFTDTTGDPGTLYSYCVYVVDSGVDTFQACASAGRYLKPPTDFVATDGTLEDQVQLTWVDRSNVEDGYLLSRAGRQSIAVNGTDEYLVTNDPVDLSGSFTLAFRARRTRTGITEAVLSHGASPDYEGFQIGFDSADRFFFWFRGDDIRTPGTYTDTDWHHYAITYDAATRMRTLYVDGVLVASDVSGAAYAGSGPLYMARLAWGSTNYFGGELDEVHYWTSVRTAGQIAGGTTALRSGMEPGLAGYWPLDAGTGTMAFDAKGGNHATFVNMDAAAWTAAPVFNLTAFLAPNTSSFVDRMTVPGPSYDYTLFAFRDPNTDRTYTDGIDFASISKNDSGSRGFVLPPAQVSATDGQRVDRVRITWQNQSMLVTGSSIYRDGSLIGTVGTETTYDDLTATTATVYTYCVANTIGGTESVQKCDEGRAGGLTPPEAVAASDNTFDDRVQLTWTDAASTENGFIIKRDGTTIDTTAANIAVYNDLTALQDTPYTYCVQAYSEADPDTPSLSDEVCDAGSRANVLAPTLVTASDDDFEDRIEIAWQSTSATVMLFNLYRVDPQTDDTTLFKTTLNSTTQYNYLRAPSDTPAAYCVAAFTIPGAPASVLAQIEQLYAERAMQEAMRRTVRETTDADPMALHAAETQFLARIEAVAEAEATLVAMRTGSTTAIVESARVCDLGSRSIKAPSAVAATFGDFEDHVDVTWADNSEVDKGFHIYRSDGLLLDGDGDHVEIPNESDFDFTTSLTVEAWFKVAAFDVSFQAIVNKGDNAWRIQRAGGSDRIAFDLTHSDGGLSGLQSTTVVNVDQWYHVAGVYDGSTIYLYINGVLEATGSLNEPLFNNSAPVLLGSNSDNLSRAFNGAIRDVRLWSVGRSAAQIAANKDIQLDGNEAGLVGYWPLDETGGTTAQDRAGSNDGILRGDAQLGSRIASLGPLRSSYSDYTGAPGVEYTYGVATYDDYGVSRPGSDTGFRELKPAAAFQASDGTFETQVVLTWLDESRGEDGYRLYRDGVEIATTAANATTYTDATGITFGMVHAYTIEAFDAYGASVRAEDDGSTVILPPTDVNASDTYPDKVVIAWLDVSDMETGYEVRRNGVAITTTAANATTYTDTGVSAGQSYTYCVVTKGSGTTASVEVCDQGNVPGATVAADFTPELLFTASSAAVNDDFGYSVAIDGDWAIVGARFTDDQNRGAVYFYERNGARWEERQFRTAPAQIDAQQGFSVAISGNYAILGAPCDIGANGLESGAAYIYELKGSTWEQVAKIIPPDGNINQLDRFGHSVSIDGDWVIVGAPDWDGVNESTPLIGRVHFYKRESNGTWNFRQTGNWRAASNPGAQYGTSVSMNGDWVAIGAPNADVGPSDTGAIDLLKREGDTWIGKALIQGFQNANMGAAVAMGDGWAVAGSPGRADGKGAITVYRRNTDGSWAFSYDQSGLVGGEALGTSVAIAGNTIVAGTFQNRVRAYTYDTSWQEANLASYGGTGNFARQAPALGISDNWIIFGAPLATNEANVQTGAVYMSAILRAPEDVQASDGMFEDRIQVTWTDLSEQEGGFHVYRREADGQLNLVGTTAAEAELFDDFSASPGGSYEYCVQAFLGNKESSLVDTSCELGWRPPNGTISGRVAALGGGGTKDVELCLSPNPNRGLLFDGIGGYVNTTLDDLSGDAITIEYWFKGESLQSAMRQQDAAGNFIVAGWFGTHILSNEGTAQQGIDVGAAATDGNWHHVAMTWQRNTAGGWSSYLDGELVEQKQSSNVPLPDIDSHVTLGSYLGSSEFTKGQLDEIRIWNIARSQADLQASMHRQLAGDEEGLVGYWAFNEGTRRVTADLTGTGNNGVLMDGAHWTEMGAFPICATTNVEGNYSLAGLQYGETTEFTLTPSFNNRTFEPGFKTITLSTEAPVQNEVIFTDATQLTIAGVVEYAGTQCPVPDVEIYIDDEFKGTTESDGTFTFATDPSADATDVRRIEPRLVNPNDAGDKHIFTPQERVLFLEADERDLTFADQKTRTLTGTFTGSCNTDIGTATIRVFTEDGCFDRTIEFSPENAVDCPNFPECTFKLPPQKYLVQVVSVQSQSDLRADIIQFFDDLGALEVDLTNQADTVNFTYRAPISVAIEGLPAPPMSCSLYTAEDGSTIPAVPIIGRAEVLPLSITAFEDYGDPDDPNDDMNTHCPVDEGTMLVFDGIADQGENAVVLAIKDGLAVYETDVTDGDDNVLIAAGSPYTTFGASPDLISGRIIGGVNRSFQKSLTAIAQVTGRPAVTATEWAVVEGTRVRQSTFVSATTGEIPLLVLHDPPGSNSYSYLEEGTTFCSTFSQVNLVGGGAGAEVDVVLGIKIGVSAGFGVIADLADVGGGLALRGKLIAGRETADTITGMEICGTTTKRYSTPGDLTWVGEDLFMGVALNLIFAESDKLDVDTAQCTLEQSAAVNMDFDPANAFETTYVYGASHIEYSLIPALDGLIALEGVEGTDEVSAEGASEAVTLQRARDNWAAMLDQNQTRIAEGLKESENRSFSAGADYEFVRDTTTTNVLNANSTTTYVKFEGGIGFIATVFYDQTFLAITEIYSRFTTETSETRTDTRTVGYVLSDGDTGDYFSVDVGTDPLFNTPVFGTRSGRSSNPWEANTQQRDKPRIQIDPPALFNVDPEGAGNFQLTLINDSESRERRQYTLAVPGETNLGNLGLTVTGDLLGGERLESFLLEPGEARTINLDVLRVSPPYSYENVGLMLYPAIEYEIWKADPRQDFPLSDTVFFDVHFQAPCSDINVLRPQNPWYFNADDTDIEIILDGFGLTVSESEMVEQLGLQYRRVGTPDWLPAADVMASDLDPEATSWSANWTPPRDGDYELRAFTSCPIGGTVFSELVLGTVDTATPKRYGSPMPSNQILHLGDEIAVSYNEPIDCATISTQGQFVNARLSYVDGPDAGQAIDGAVAVCRDNRIVFEPPTGFDWAAAENLTLMAELLTGVVDGGGNPVDITDLAGNPIEQALSWSFIVQRSAFTWQPLAVSAVVNRYTTGMLSATLVNGRQAPTTYTLSGVPDWLTPSSASGTLGAGTSEDLTFIVADTLEAGTYQAVITATSDEGPAALNVLVTVADLQQQAIALNSGWTWFSLNRTPASAQPDSVLRALAPLGGDLVKSQTAFSLYDGDGSWLGSLMGITPTNAYQVKISQGGTLLVDGPEVDPVTPIPVVVGWNWIGYLPQVPLPIDDALASLDATGTPGDQIKSQTAFAAYNGTNWIGSLTQLDPGQGYMLDRIESGTLVYPATAAPLAVKALPASLPDATSRSVRAAALEAQERGSDAPRKVVPGEETRAEGNRPELALTPSAYQHSMTLIGHLTFDGEPLDDPRAEVWLTDVDGSVRGTAQPRYVEALGEHRLFLMLHSDAPQGEAYAVHVYDPATERTVTLDAYLAFEADRRVGTLAEPIAIAAETDGYKAAKEAEELPAEFALAQNYPNPFNPTTTIHYELPEASQVSLVVYDVLGREVLRLVDTEQSAGRYDVALDASRLASGVYLYRIEAGTFRQTHTMTLMK